LKIAIDDFGTGYSSYAYLQKLPIDLIKIDKMFTQALVDSNFKGEGGAAGNNNYQGFIQNRAIVLSIIELGKHAGYDIVAEGVETINQMNFLKEHKCKYGQGYFFSRPIPADDAERLLYENALTKKQKSIK
jgi:EAL domain-containing protein (putative c-di-GMP-specific phosphodiesterase class I)